MKIVYNNNSYHESLGMFPFEGLYGRKCWSSTHWQEAGKRWFWEIDIIKRRLQTTVDGQKKYTQNFRQPLEFKVGDKVFLKVSPMRGVMRFGKKGKLSPRYVGSFEIIERIGEVA